MRDWFKSPDGIPIRDLSLTIQIPWYIIVFTSVLISLSLTSVLAPLSLLRFLHYCHPVTSILTPLSSCHFGSYTVVIHLGSYTVVILLDSYIVVITSVLTPLFPVLILLFNSVLISLVFILQFLYCLSFWFTILIALSFFQFLYHYQYSWVLP